MAAVSRHERKLGNLMTGSPSDIFGPEILKIFWVYEGRRDFFGVAEKRTKEYFWVTKKELRDFLGMLKNVAIFLGRQILKL